MKTKILLLLSIAIIVVLQCCTYRIVDFTIISTKNIDLSHAANFKKGQQRNKGEDKVYWLVFIPLGVPNLKEAIDKTIEQTPGAVALVDGVVYQKSMWFILTGFSAYIVEGTPLIHPTTGSVSETQSQYNMCKLDRKLNVVEKKVISKEEFEKERKKIIKKR